MQKYAKILIVLFTKWGFTISFSDTLINMFEFCCQTLVLLTFDFGVEIQMYLHIRNKSKKHYILSSVSLLHSYLFTSNSSFSLLSRQIWRSLLSFSMICFWRVFFPHELLQCVFSGLVYVRSFYHNVHLHCCHLSMIFQFLLLLAKSSVSYWRIFH